MESLCEPPRMQVVRTVLCAASPRGAVTRTKKLMVRKFQNRSTDDASVVSSANPTAHDFFYTLNDERRVVPGSSKPAVLQNFYNP